MRIAKSVLCLALATSGIALAHENEGKKAKNDKSAIEFFVPHHKDAIEMLSRCQQVAAHPELKQQCATSRADQERESTQMKDWYRSWFNADAPESMPTPKAMKVKMDKLKTLEGDAFDELFLMTMAQHHQQGISEGKLCSRSAQKDELKSLCTEMATKQSEERKKLMDWHHQWFGQKKAMHKGH